MDQFKQHIVSDTKPSCVGAIPVPNFKASTTLEGVYKELIGKFLHLQQLVEQLNSEEFLIREKMQKNCHDLKKEVDKLEMEQSAIRNALAQFKTFDKS